MQRFFIAPPQNPPLLQRTKRFSGGNNNIIRQGVSIYLAAEHFARSAKKPRLPPETTRTTGAVESVTSFNNELFNTFINAILSLILLACSLFSAYKRTLKLRRIV